MSLQNFDRDEADNVWPMDPSSAFCLLVTRAKEDDIPDAHKKPPSAGEEDEDEEQKKMSPEQQSQERLKYLAEKLTPLSSMKLSSSDSPVQIVELGQVVQLHLELRSIVDIHRNKDGSSTSSSSSSSSSHSPLAPPREAFDLVQRVKVNAVRWEVKLPGTPARWVEAPNCRRGFPFFDASRFFHPTADCCGMTMRAVAVLADATTDKNIMVRAVNNNNSSNNRNERPSLIASEHFVVMPTAEQRQTMALVEQRRQIGVFAKEKKILEPLAVSLPEQQQTQDEIATTEREQNDIAEENSKQQMAPSQSIEIVRSECERTLLVACRRVETDSDEDAAVIQIRVCVPASTDKKEQQPQPATTILFEGMWSETLCKSSSSPCILSDRDEFTMTFHLFGKKTHALVDENRAEGAAVAAAIEQEEKQELAVPVTFPTRKDRDLAALGIRSLL